MSSKLVVLAIVWCLGSVALGSDENRSAHPSSNDGLESNESETSSKPSADSPYFIKKAATIKATYEELNYINQLSDTDRKELSTIVFGSENPFEALGVTYNERMAMREMEPHDRTAFVNKKYTDRLAEIKATEIKLKNSISREHLFKARQTYVERATRISDLQNKLLELNSGPQPITKEKYETSGKLLAELTAEDQSLQNFSKSNNQTLSDHEQDRQGLDKLAKLDEAATNAYKILKDPRLEPINDYLVPDGHSKVVNRALSVGGKLGSWGIGTLGFSIGMVGNVLIRCNIIEARDKAICKSLYSSFQSLPGALNLLIFSAGADIPREWAMSLVSKGASSPYSLPIASAATKMKLVARTSRTMKTILLKVPALQTGFGMIMGSGISKAFGKATNSDGARDVKRDFNEIGYNLYGKWAAEVDNSKRELDEMTRLKAEIEKLQSQLKTRSATPEDKQNAAIMSQKWAQLQTNLKQEIKNYNFSADRYSNSLIEISKYSAHFFWDITRAAGAAFQWSEEERVGFYWDTASMLATTGLLVGAEWVLKVAITKAQLSERIERAASKSYFNNFKAGAERKKYQEAFQHLIDPEYRYSLRDELEYFNDTAVPREVRAQIGQDLKVAIAQDTTTVESIEGMLASKVLAKRILSPADWRGIYIAFKRRISGAITVPIFGFISPILSSALNATVWTLLDEYFTKPFFSINKEIILMPTYLNAAWGYKPLFSLPWTKVEPVETIISNTMPMPISQEQWIKDQYENVSHSLDKMDKVWQDYRSNVILLRLNSRVTAWKSLVDENHIKFIKRKNFLSLFEAVRAKDVPRYSFKYLPHQLIPNPYESNAAFLAGQRGPDRWHSDPSDLNSFGGEVAEFIHEYQVDLENWIANRKSIDLKKAGTVQTEEIYFRDYLRDISKANESVLRKELEDDKDQKGNVVRKGATKSLTEIVTKTYYTNSSPPTFGMDMREIDHMSMPYNMRSSFWQQIYDLNSRTLIVLDQLKNYTTKDGKPIPEMVEMQQKLQEWNSSYYNNGRSVSQGTMNAFGDYITKLPTVLLDISKINHDYQYHHRIDFMLTSIAAKMSTLIEQYTLLEPTAKSLVSPTFTDQEIDDDALDTKPLTQAQKFSMTPSQITKHEASTEENRVKKLGNANKDPFENSADSLKEAAAAKAAELIRQGRTNSTQGKKSTNSLANGVDVESGKPVKK
jgi:hypothetical protein